MKLLVPLKVFLFLLLFPIYIVAKPNLTVVIPNKEGNMVGYVDVLVLKKSKHGEYMVLLGKDTNKKYWLLPGDKVYKTDLLPQQVASNSLFAKTATKLKIKPNIFNSKAYIYDSKLHRQLYIIKNNRFSLQKVNNAIKQANIEPKLPNNYRKIVKFKLIPITTIITAANNLNQNPNNTDNKNYITVSIYHETLNLDKALLQLLSNNLTKFKNILNGVLV